MSLFPNPLRVLATAFAAEAPVQPAPVADELPTTEPSDYNRLTSGRWVKENYHLEQLGDRDAKNEKLEADVAKWKRLFEKKKAETNAMRERVEFKFRYIMKDNDGFKKWTCGECKLVKPSTEFADTHWGILGGSLNPWTPGTLMFREEKARLLAKAKELGKVVKRGRAAQMVCKYCVHGDDKWRIKKVLNLGSSEVRKLRHGYIYTGKSIKQMDGCCAHKDESGGALMIEPGSGCVVLGAGAEAGTVRVEFVIEGRHRPSLLLANGKCAFDCMCHAGRKFFRVDAKHGREEPSAKRSRHV